MRTHAEAAEVVNADCECPDRVYCKNFPLRTDAMSLSTTKDRLDYSNHEPIKVAVRVSLTVTTTMADWSLQSHLRVNWSASHLIYQLKALRFKLSNRKAPTAAVPVLQLFISSVNRPTTAGPSVVRWDKLKKSFQCNRTAVSLVLRHSVI